MHTNNSNKNVDLVQAFDASEERKEELMNEVRALKKELAYAKFKIKRTIKDKEIVTNVLNETIKSLEEKSEVLVSQAAELEQQSRFKEELFANVSHELRTPLHGILGMSHLLEKTPLNIVQKEYVDIVKGSADNLLVIVNDILSLSEINAGKMKIKKETFSLRKFLKGLEGIFFAKTKEKNIQLSFLTSPSIPEYVFCDPTRLYQILINLLNNAVKFTHEGCIILSSEVIHQEGDNIQLQFEIKDTGIGMKENEISKIFESFTRVHEDKGVVYEGSGLGLNIVKNLLHLLDGSVDVESKIGKGTTFKIQIPVQYPTASDIEKLKNKEPEDTIPKEWSKLKFLMIEDNSANILYAKDIFVSWNLNLDIAPRLETAKELLTKSYDCILSDVILPDGNGLDFITSLRNDNQAINQNTPVIILTASSNEKGAEQARNVNIESYLSKPFPPEVLIQSLQNIFNKEKKQPQISIQEKGAHNNQENKNGLIDEVFLEKLSKRFKGRTGLMVEMSKIFLDQAAFIIPILEESHSRGDYEEIRFEAHKFKSTANIVGLDSLVDFAAKTEESYHDGKPKIDTQVLLGDFVNQIKTDIKKVKIAIEKLELVEINF